MRPTLLLPLLLLAPPNRPSRPRRNALPHPPQTITYFQQGDNIGAKDENGRIIVPAQHPSTIIHQNGDTETSSEISFYNAPCARHNAAGTAPFIVYNRQGKYLHHALMYDMGEDYYVEGKRRVIAPNKKWHTPTAQAA